LGILAWPPSQLYLIVLFTIFDVIYNTWALFIYIMYFKVRNQPFTTKRINLHNLSDMFYSLCYLHSWVIQKIIWCKTLKSFRTKIKLLNTAVKAVKQGCPLCHHFFWEHCWENIQMIVNLLQIKDNAWQHENLKQQNGAYDQRFSAVKHK
jgi:hypothetical protein